MRSPATATAYIRWSAERTRAEVEELALLIAPSQAYRRVEIEYTTMHQYPSFWRPLRAGSSGAPSRPLLHRGPTETAFPLQRSRIYIYIGCQRFSSSARCQNDYDELCRHRTVATLDVVDQREDLGRLNSRSYSGLSVLSGFLGLSSTSPFSSLSLRWIYTCPYSNVRLLPEHTCRWWLFRAVMTPQY